MVDKHEVDDFTGTPTTGHDWDGIKELNTPLPRWWLWLFYITIVWGIGYVIAMPAWPLISSYTTGVLGASQREQVLAEHSSAIAARTEKGKGLLEASAEEIRKNTGLMEFAMANGKAAFGDNCAPCHGSGATGFVGYPNLQDDDWLWGGTVDEIYTTIRYGIRAAHDESRVGDMTAFGDDEVLEKAEITNVAAYVRSLSGLDAGAGDKAAGAEIYADNCAACHGDDAKGMVETGAPNLTNNIWLYGDSNEAIVASITHGRKGVMPAWEGRLDPITVKSLAIYVHSLGGGL